MSINIPSAPAYGVYASQLIRFARCCSNYSDFLSRHRALVTRLLPQDYQINRLSHTFKKFYGRHTDLVGQYKKNVCQTFAYCTSYNDFFQTCQSWIDKISWDGGCHEWSRSRLLYPEHLVITSTSYRCTIHSLCYQLAKYFCKQLGFVELFPRIWIAVFWFLSICLLLVYFVSAAGCYCFDLWILVFYITR